MKPVCVCVCVMYTTDCTSQQGLIQELTLSEGLNVMVSVFREILLYRPRCSLKRLQHMLQEREKEQIGKMHC